MSHRYDVIVVGVGTMGASACWQLARRGARVLGLEQFDIPHAFGSASGFSRMIRLAYFEHPDYVALLRRAYDLWDQIERDSGQKVLHITGGLYLGRPDSELVGGSLGAAQKYELPHEMLDRAQLASRYAMFHLPDDFVGFFEKKAGFVIADRAVAVFADQALRHGAELRGREAVTGWRATSAGVQVQTQHASYEAKHAIFCGGAWSDRLVRDLGVKLIVTRQVLGWVWPRRPELFALGRFPVFAIDPALRGEFVGVYYGFPMMPDITGGPGFKIALHYPGAPTDPDSVERGALDGDVETFAPALRQYLPDADGPLLSLRTCLYTNSPDSHFIIDRHPAHANVTLACGFSGHGFKFASAIGEALADLAMHGRTELPIGFLSLKRFAR